MIKVLACNGSFFNHTVFVSSAALLSLPSQTIALVAIFAKQAKNKRKTQLLGFAQNKSKVVAASGDGGMRSCSAESSLSGRRASQPRTLACSVAATAWVRANNRSQKNGVFLITPAALWRRRWDSNPRAGLNRQLDFESSSLRPLRYVSKTLLF